jgi:hypothetical protein
VLSRTVNGRAPNTESEDVVDVTTELCYGAPVGRPDGLSGQRVSGEQATRPPCAKFCTARAGAAMTVLDNGMRKSELKPRVRPATRVSGESVALYQGEGHG